jgi:hypothetical protein
VKLYSFDLYLSLQYSVIQCLVLQQIFQSIGPYGVAQPHLVLQKKILFSLC